MKLSCLYFQSLTKFVFFSRTLARRQRNKNLATTRSTTEVVACTMCQQVLPVPTVAGECSDTGHTGQLLLTPQKSDVSSM